MRIVQWTVDTAGLTAQLGAEPQATAIMLDVDGTLAPIVPRPEDAVVPDETRALLERLVNRYALVAFVSGRTSDDAAALVAVEGAVYVGEHGLELGPARRRVGAADCRVRRLRRLARRAEAPVRGVPLAHGQGRAGRPDRIARGRGTRAGRRAEAALGTQGAGGAAARRSRQRDCDPTGARRARATPRALRGRRRHRPRRIPRAGRARAGGARGDRLGGGAERARRGRGHSPRWTGGARRPPPHAL